MFYWESQCPFNVTRFISGMQWISSCCLQLCEIRFLKSSPRGNPCPACTAVCDRARRMNTSLQPGRSLILVEEHPARRSWRRLQLQWPTDQLLSMLLAWANSTSKNRFQSHLGFKAFSSHQQDLLQTRPLSMLPPCSTPWQALSN